MYGSPLVDFRNIWIDIILEILKQFEPVDISGVFQVVCVSAGSSDFGFAHCRVVKTVELPRTWSKVLSVRLVSQNCFDKARHYSKIKIKIKIIKKIKKNKKKIETRMNSINNQANALMMMIIIN